MSTKTLSLDLTGGVRFYFNERLAKTALGNRGFLQLGDLVRSGWVRCEGKGTNRMTVVGSIFADVIL